MDRYPKLVEHLYDEIVQCIETKVKICQQEVRN